MGFNIYSNRDNSPDEALPPPIIEAGEVEALPPSVTEIAHTPIEGAPPDVVTETKYYDCGYSATGPGGIPNYCPEHGTPPVANAIVLGPPEDNSKLESAPKKENAPSIEKVENEELSEPRPTVFPCKFYHIDGSLSSRLIFSAQEAKALGNEWTHVKPENAPRQPIRWPASPSTIGAPDPKAKPKLANEFL